MTVVSGSAGNDVGRGDGGKGGYLNDAKDSRPGDRLRLLFFEVADGAGDLDRPLSGAAFGV